MVAIVGCSTLVGFPRPRPGEQTHQQFRKEVSSVAELDYLLYVPRGSATEPSKKWPLVLFLHGAGERGSDLSKVAVHGPPKLAAAGGDLPFILVSPQCPVGKIWDATLLIKLLDQIQGRLSVDSRRVYVTGLSMGLRHVGLGDPLSRAFCRCGPDLRWWRTDSVALVVIESA